MTPTTNSQLVQKRQQAIELLVSQLHHYHNSDAVVVAIPKRGVPVGYKLAQMLHLSFDVMPCRKIKHPSDHDQSIGSVSINDSYVGEGCRNIPQDYVYHQIALIQHALIAKNTVYEKFGHIDVKGKAVILVDDVLQTGSTALACIKSIRKSDPKKVVLAAPLVSPSALALVLHKADETVYLTKIDYDHQDNLHLEFPSVTESEVKKLLMRAREEHALLN